MKKYVYLLQSLENGYYKIGVSKNPQKRIDQLQTGNSSEIKLKYVFLSEIPYKVESSIKNYYLSYRKKGEWFDLPLLEEQKFIEKCKNIEFSIQYIKQKGNVFI